MKPTLHAPARSPPCVVKDLEGRGRGLCATRPIARGERLFVSSCFGYAVDDTCASPQQLCHGCLAFGTTLEVRCEGCGTSYCSDACMEHDRAAGHLLCCRPLARMATVGRRKTTSFERSAACFLLRAFARRRVERDRPPTDAPVGHDDADDADDVTHDDAMRQCPDHEGIAGFPIRQAARQRAARLAMLQGGKLMSQDDALRLLLVEPQNSYSLRDPSGTIRGWLMYPRASMMNHSCVPNCACVVEGTRVTFYALVDIAAGEECTQCYLQLAAAEVDSDGAESTASWGFECGCPRCDRAAHTAERAAAIAAFDAEHRCVCGCIVVPSLASGDVCRCHDVRPLGQQTGPGAALAATAAGAPRHCSLGHDDESL